MQIYDVNKLEVTMLKTTKQRKQSGAVEACWAHNLEVRESKPFSAKRSFFGNSKTWEHRNL